MHDDHDVPEAKAWTPTREQLAAYLAREQVLGRINVAVLLERKFFSDRIEPDFDLNGFAMSPRTISTGLRSLRAFPLSTDERREVRRRQTILRNAKRLAR